MAISVYHDFILVADSVETDERNRIVSFAVRVFDSPQGQGERPEPVAVGAELDEHLRSQSSALEHRLLKLSEQIDLGYRLGKLLMQPGARALYDRSLDFLRDKPDQGLRIRLRLEPELSGLPWEYIYLKEPGPQADLSGFAILNPRVSFVRHEALALRAEWFEPPEPAGKRRVVIAMATPGENGDYPELKDLPEEQRQIDIALRRVKGIDPVFLPRRYGEIRPGAPIEGATIVQVEDELTRPTDIFHFSGHGEFEDRPVAGSAVREGKSYVILADERNRAERIPAERLGRAMERGNVRLVVLGACETAKGDSKHKLSSCAVALLAGHVGCVVAMQFRIYSHLAALFAEAFYEALVAGLLVDEAVALGRGAIRDRILADGSEDRDWGVPVLHLRTPGGRVFNPVKEEQLSKEAGRRSAERFDMGAAWWNWMAEGTTASREQLEQLAKAGDALALGPAQAIMLMRSAQVHFAPQETWLALLRRGGADLVARLDDPHAAVGAPAEVRRTLALDDEIQRERPAGVGPVAWAAVRGEDPFARQAAALTLTALPGDDRRRDGIGRALDRLETALAGYRGPKREFGHCPRLRSALSACTAPWERFKRRAELRGALADADPELEARNRELPLPHRFGAWSWRVRRQVLADSRRIRSLVLGAALGGGLALGLFRALLGLCAGPGTRTLAAVSLFWGGFLGAAIGLAVGLAPSLLLEQGRRARDEAATRRRREVLSVLLGTLLFGVAHALTAWFNLADLGEKGLFFATALLVGCGASQGLYGLSRADPPVKVGTWLGRLAVAVACALLAQWIVFAGGKGHEAMAMSRTAEAYEFFYVNWSPTLLRLVRQWPEFVAYADVSTVALLFTAGAAAGAAGVSGHHARAGRAVTPSS